MRARGAVIACLLCLHMAGCDKALSKTFVNSVGMRFVLIPAGEFVMGSPPDEAGRGVDERQHSVRIEKAFYISTTEVTCGQWKKVVDGDPMSYMPDFYKPPNNHPVCWLPYWFAVDFCEILSKAEGRKYRLPTEAEWEYACRAGTETPWFFGKDPAKLKEYAWITADLSKLHPVGKLKPNPWGLFDTYGNAAEWVGDPYQPYPGGKAGCPWPRKKGDEVYVTRGGIVPKATDTPLRYIRSAARHVLAPGFGAAGIRVVCELESK